MSKQRSYSWDFKAEVLAMYEVDGPAAAARLYKVFETACRGGHVRQGSLPARRRKGLQRPL